MAERRTSLCVIMLLRQIFPQMMFVTLQFLSDCNNCGAVFGGSVFAVGEKAENVFELFL
jgi:hypothetical protein